MKVKSILIGWMITLLLLFSCQSGSKDHLKEKAVIPRPVYLEKTDGYFRFDRTTRIVAESPEMEKVLEHLTSLFTKAAGFTPIIEIGEKEGEVQFITDKNLKEEAYYLDITSSGIEVRASGEKGFFYAIQTLRQLLPSEIESTRIMKGIMWSVPTVRIQDEPRFEYRGLMLDASRYFIPKETVLKVIDCAAMLKINKLHFHLTDDNGWRLEIKKYPLLTEVGAWRVARDEPFSGRRNPKKGEPTPVGGFYTQEDIKEIVHYAAERQIEVIPEIEMPAHSNSALAAYPELACPVVDNFIGVLPGLGGDNSEIIYCAGNEAVYTFLEGVLDEVMELFPSGYIHLGGDEAAKTNWKKCPECQACMRKHNLTDEEDLQGYFMKRMGKYVRSKGKQPMGWDELTNSELPEDVIIYGWQGYGTAALKAAHKGHRFIMTPARILYLIRYQGPQWFEPYTYFGNVTLKDVYDYEPVRNDWEPEVAELLMGIQGCMWTEFCTTPKDVEYLLFPRLAALAEIAWIPASTKDWDDFLKRLDKLTRHWEWKDINFATSMYNIDHFATPNNNGLQVALNCIRPDVEIRYTTDGSLPVASSLLYYDTLFVNKPCKIMAATFVNGKQKGKVLELYFNFNKATGKPIEGNNPNVFVLTNGLRGSEKHSDFEWVGWYEQDASFTVDLEEIRNISTIRLGSITNYGMAVHMPSCVKVYTSNDKQNFELIAEKTFTQEEIFQERTYTQDILFDQLSVGARYIKIEATNAGVCPEDHLRPRQGTWMYFDEIIIE